MPSEKYNNQGCHWSGKGQGNLEFVREIWNFVESQGHLEFVREIWNFVESESNLIKVREILENFNFIRGCGDQLAYPIFLGSRLHRSHHFSTHIIGNLPFFTNTCYLKHMQACT